MKSTVKYIMALIVAGSLFSSCKKAIDLDPTHTINGDDFFETVDEYDFVLTGTYQRLKQNGLYGGVNGGSLFLSAVDIAADNFYNGPDNLGNLNTAFRWNYTADNPSVQAAWDDAYRVIQHTNLSVRGIDRFAATDRLKVNRIEGQARALRAFMHFELLRWWAADYDRNSTALGIAYVDKFDIEQMPARLTVKQTYDKIEADLKTARAMVSNTDKPIQSATSTAGTNRAYIDRLVCDAMLARMYLYANELDSAIKYASLVINARPLASQASFMDIWHDASTAEVIWSIKYQAAEPALAREIYQTAGDLISWEPVDDLLNLYDIGDIRFDAYWADVNGHLVLGKYSAKATALGNPDGVTDFKILRTGEMYLIRSEAYARKTGMGAQALADLNALRSVRGAVTGSETGTALLTAIQTERRKELMMEGHRFFDLKRTTRTVNRTQSCNSFCTLLPANRAWAFPVPQTEMLANRNMEQNPGY
ncbi:MAG TPA: RagB/SusD family nutrient uptake outer membrane protein [Chitinophagaceae bacterium]